MVYTEKYEKISNDIYHLFEISKVLDEIKKIQSDIMFLMFNY